ncbi:protein rep [Globicatella sanguinis]
MQKSTHEFDPNERVNEHSNQKSYKELKLKSIKASNYYHSLALYDKANKLNDCGTWLEFLKKPTEFKDFTKLNRANFCRERFCPFCADRLRIMNQFKLDTILSCLADTQPNIQYIFLTLTTPNVTKDKLKDELDALNKAFNKLIKDPKVKDNVLGHVKAVHVTYKSPYKSNGNTYHPHLHVLIALNEKFNKNTRKYVTKADWFNLWQKYRPDVKIDAEYGVEVDYLKTNRHQACIKVAKYIAKPLEDHLVNQECFETMTTTLKGRRLLELTGIFRELSKDFKNGNLDKYIQKNAVYYTHIMCSTWHFRSQMYMSETRLLKDEEEIFFNLNKGEFL